VTRSRSRDEGRTISVRTSTSADRWETFGLLAELDQHWRFAGDFVDVLRLDGPAGARTGGVLRVRGPLGIRRTATTCLVSARAPCTLQGTATTAHGTSAWIDWTLSDAPSGTIVELTVTIVHAGTLDRVLLALGGRAWLRRQLAATLRRVSTAAAHQIEARTRQRRSLAVNYR
jgi:hypothetical protein